MKEEFLNVGISLYRRARKRSYVASYVLGLLRGAPVVFARKKAFTEYFHPVPHQSSPRENLDARALVRDARERALVSRRRRGVALRVPNVL